MTATERLLSTERPFLTDGGFETWLFFHEGFEAPEFAAIVLMDDPSARQAMQRYFERFLAMAAGAKTGFVLDTNTWRGCVTWAEKLGLAEADLLDLSGNAVAFAKDLRDRWRDRVAPIVINGAVGPAGDGYRPDEVPDAAEAEAMHRRQIACLADAGVDMISAITMTNTGEAIGIARTAAAERLPVVISFTVETDGRLPTGETLGEAIRAVDGATENAPLYYMINCAHPEHFGPVLREDADWIRRIGGVRANASRLSHAELDASETLDEGDPEEFGRLHAEISQCLPNLRVVGGCCGTDHRHVGCVSHHLHAREPA